MQDLKGGRVVLEEGREPTEVGNQKVYVEIS